MQHEIKIPLQIGKDLKEGDSLLLSFQEATKQEPVKEVIIEPVKESVISVPAKEPYDRKKFHLTLPVDSKGVLKNTAFQVEPEEFTKYNSEWFKSENEKYTFICPDGGATTSSATKFARCEARHRTDFSGSASSTMTLVMSVDKLMKKGIIQQIHGGSLGNSDKPWFKVTAEILIDGRVSIYARCRKSNGSEVNLNLGVVSLGDIFTLKSSYNATEKSLTFSFNDGLEIKLNDIYISKNYYWKCGAYYQNTSRLNNLMQVTHYLGCKIP